MLLAPVPQGEVASNAGAGVPAGLFYSSDENPGYLRVRKGSGFAYKDESGHWLRDAAQIARIRKLAIPPAYTAVWICKSPNGHLQATGRDARGRKQYRYHARWREERDEGKFDRMMAFARTLPKLRRQVKLDLALPGLTRQRILGAIVHLLDTTLVRVGNDQYARENKSFGLTTLRNRHVSVKPDGVKLSFKGKSGVLHDIEVKDPRVVKLVRKCLHLPGQELFQYQDEAGAVHAVSSGDVNDYLHAVCGEDFTAKDFRTWHGSALALEALYARCRAAGHCFTLKEMLTEVSGRLGNTPAVCRKAYVHPRVLELTQKLAGSKGEMLFADEVPSASKARGLSASEQRLLAFLQSAPQTLNEALAKSIDRVRRKKVQRTTHARKRTTRHG